MDIPFKDIQNEKNKHTGKEGAGLIFDKKNILAISLILNKDINQNIIKKFNTNINTKKINNIIYYKVNKIFKKDDFNRLISKSYLSLNLCYKFCIRFHKKFEKNINDKKNDNKYNPITQLADRYCLDRNALLFLVDCILQTDIKVEHDQMSGSYILDILFQNKKNFEACIGKLQYKINNSEIFDMPEHIKTTGNKLYKDPQNYKKFHNKYISLSMIADTLGLCAFTLFTLEIEDIINIFLNISEN